MTEEIYVYPEGSDDFLFRVSMVALSTTGPFSIYPGIDRSLILLEGKPIRLNDLVVPLLSPVSFSGEDKINATVETDGWDLNLMCRRGRASGKIHVCTGEAGFPDEADLCVIFALSDSVCLGNIQLRRYESCVLGSDDRNIKIKGDRFLRIEVAFSN